MSDFDAAAGQGLRQRLGEFARVELVGAETPFDRLRHLGRDLGIDLWLKRDDLTPLAFGGDKPRKLEFELGRALAEGADVIVTCGSSQSNHARLTTAAAKRLGLDAIVVLSRDEHTEFQGNLLTVRLMGAEVTIVDAADHWDLETDALEICERLRSEDRTPHYVPVSGTTPLSCLGYVVGALELAEQMESREVRPDVIYLPFGTGGIFTATLLTLRILGISTRVVGISVNRDVKTCRDYLDRWWGELGRLLQIDDSIDRGDYALYDEFVGREYGDATAEGLDAIVAMASTEGVLLDPVYSGKVFAGLRAHRENGLIPEGATVVMLHSGGTPALFAYYQELAAHLGLDE